MRRIQLLSVPLAAAALLGAPAARACDMHGMFGPGDDYGEPLPAAFLAAIAEEEAMARRDRAMADARTALVARFGIKTDPAPANPDTATRNSPPPPAPQR